jgi:hypothetical protein
MKRKKSTHPQVLKASVAIEIRMTCIIGPKANEQK